MLKTARTFVSVTSEKHASSASGCTADHPICTCRKFKASIFELAMTFLKPFCSLTVFAAVVDFADLPSDTQHSGYSESLPFGLKSLYLATFKIEPLCVYQWLCLCFIVWFQHLIRCPVARFVRWILVLILLYFSLFLQFLDL
jgi:hypothetical protein